MKRYSLKRKSKRKSGGGYGEGPSYIAPGYLVHQAYQGSGKDCAADSFTRDGHISNYNQYGLPGFKGGRRGGSLQVAPFIDTPKAPVANAPVANAPVANAPVANPTNAPVKGGALYGFFPEWGPLNTSNGAGTSSAQFGRTACDSGSTNSLNPNPNGIQSLTTVYPYTRGGKRNKRSQHNKRNKRSQRNKHSQRNKRNKHSQRNKHNTRNKRIRGGMGADIASAYSVNVGQRDSMVYNAPTAGYRNDFMTFRAPSPVPGLTLQTPYDAKSFNQACIKGGSRKRSRRSKGGSCPIAYGAAEYSKDYQAENRSDFDFTKGGLPVKI